MRTAAALSGLLLFLTGDASYAAQPEEKTMSQSTMTVTRKGTQASSQGPAEYFTGSVRVDPLFPIHGPESRVSAVTVTFQPGARSAWHTHPLGQALIVTGGVGWVQQLGGEKYEIRPGDVVWTPPGVEHWHGAPPNESLTHIALQETLDGKNVQWMEKVTDPQYLGGKVAAAAQATPAASRSSDNELASVAPALERYRQDVLVGDLWKRPSLTARDRSIVTVAALVARNQTPELAHYLELALDNGVKPSELSEILTHLAFYSGWSNAVAAAGVARDVFGRRGVTPSQLPPAAGELLPLDERAEAQRAATVEQSVGSVSPGLVHYTAAVLFRNLWLRPALAPRDRSLVTVAALIASGQVAQMTFHLNRAMDSGLTKGEASEVLAHLAFYAGWPNVFSAVPVAREVFEKRPR
jgi:4-carboxymuconolactone decarboxylase